MEENNTEIKEINKDQNGQKPIVAAIIIAGALIAGAILLRGGPGPSVQNAPVVNNGTPAAVGAPAPVTSADRILGNSGAKVTLVLYEDFQCPFCGQFVREVEQNIRDTYVKDGSLRLVYRDFAFLGQFVQPYVAANDESINSAEAARCAGDQGKFWEYHDYLFAHQNGENKGGFSVTNLETFAKDLALDTASFNQCLSGGKYAQAVADSKTEGTSAGVTGTPKGFIMAGGKVLSTIDGAEPLAATKAKIDAALK